MRTQFAETPAEVERWLNRRKALGQDRFDEMWEGVYHVAPEAHGWHGDVDQQLAERLGPRGRRAGLVGTGPLNLGTDKDDFRVPDRAFLRQRSSAVYNPTAEIVVEILSPDDESRAKFGFYFGIGVAEILLADPRTREIEWWTRGADGFVRTGRSELLDVDEHGLAAEIDWPG